MRLMWVAAVTLAVTGLVTAQEQSGNLEELNRKYQDALAQLKAAQDRKNELATENERLLMRLAETEKQLEQTKQQVAELAGQTFKLRSHYAAWQAFIRRYPLMQEKWQIFVQSNPLAVPADLPEMLDPSNTLPVE